ncbi:winged helix-turn-helix domain-containing protein [Aliarcobacter skirrowii]|uniref:winged helix-turn-helix domain-containing protein n=1 Tax=Aliarcobacter skirrowii TaxID=28200 RepID=UPI0021B2CE4D|nr:winged helix-turn-helix domain-containing protein [Aliarcobacter skirrowii]MCT7446169.1 winged helix-turn-helix domain-containing protein [Aliarcobacter skirrowii]
MKVKEFLKKYKIISWKAARTTFYKRVENEIVDGGINMLFEIISKNSGLSAVEISNKSNIPLRTVQRQVKELKDKNLIEYKGSKKTGGYYAK